MNEQVKPEQMLKAAIGKHLQECQMTDGIAGDLVTFKKGDFVRGPDKTPVPKGTRFRPNPWEFWWGWQNFEGGRVAGLKLCRVTEGQPPSRNELGDLDETLWEADRDPWQMNSRFVAQDMQGQLVTFSTQSSGGQRACKDLLKAYFADRDHPDEWPVVEIGTGYFTSNEYGQIAKPVFTIVDWVEPWAPPSGNLLTLPASTDGKGGNGTAKALEAPKAKTSEAPSFESELDDEMPF
jgi:hypothetical protein